MCSGGGGDVYDPRVLGVGGWALGVGVSRSDLSVHLPTSALTCQCAGSRATSVCTWDPSVHSLMRSLATLALTCRCVHLQLQHSFADLSALSPTSAPATSACTRRWFELRPQCSLADLRIDLPMNSCADLTVHWPTSAFTGCSSRKQG